MADISSKPNINKMFVFDTKISCFYFDHDLDDEVYDIEDPRLKMEATVKDPQGMYDALNEHINRFLNSPPPITVLDYAPDTALALKQLHENFKQEGFGHLLFITFIHSDEDCKYLGFKKYEDAIWQKYDFMNSFLLFPFINKIEIPIDYCIERDYINRLFMAAHSFPLLPVSDEGWAAYAAKKQRRKGDTAI
ncbi:MAG: hypothetical protein LBP71_00915 [Spirochaetaceae bacterium]|jgi:hypothetical protein|nr:hypothetical protein [Spirochaetaceae bacterium]